ncbi:AAA family ATPase [Deinococcus sp.]|uniref:AAA family ATPase n=1 Tax=Deinococcus sp. TaxID=47478 RepID=UPI003B5C59D9
MIESITLHGFKSFAERTRLDIGPGVTAVIGPNGSGKSNVVEALRWVTHQARARELRAARASELIFHGSGQVGRGKAPLGLAEVQLELRGQAGPLSLSRRLYRDGSAEHDLGNRPVRVRDIHASLRGTGLGPGGLAVIGQGEVVGVVQAEGKALLGFLQEAAGLSRAVAARQDTETRLQAAAASLTELTRLRGELAARVDRLTADTDAARRQRALSLRELALVDALHRHRQLTLRAELAAAQARAAELQAASAELAHQTGQASSALQLASEALQALRADQAAQRQASELLNAAETAEAQVNGSVRRLETEQRRLDAELSGPDPAPPAAEPNEAVPLQAELTRLRAELARFETERRALDEQIARARRTQVQAAETVARQQTRLESEQAEQNELQDAAAQLVPALQDARAALELSIQQRQHAERQAQHTAQLRARLQTRTVIHERQLAERRAARTSAQREHARLDTLLGSYARYGEGPRHALTSSHPGVIGSVADVLHLDAAYQTALSAALGRRSEQVVVRGEKDARELIALLKVKGGRATFLPLDLLRPRARRDAAFLRQPGVIGNLADLCPSNPPQVAEALLADTLVLADLAAATRLARTHAQRPRLVTLDGETLEPGGALTGGRLRDGGVGVLADQRRLQELADELTSVQRREARLERCLTLLTTRAVALPTFQADPALTVAERMAERQVTALETELNSLQERQRKLSTRRETPEAAPAASSQTDLPNLEAQAAEVEQTLISLRQAERAQTEALTAASTLAAEWTLYRAAAAARNEKRERRAAAAQIIVEQAAQLALAQTEVTRRRAEVQNYPAAHLAEIDAQQQRASRHYANLLARQNKLQAELSEAQLLTARREGSLEAFPDGASLPGSAREFSAELISVRAELLAIGPVNARAESELTEEAERLTTLDAEHQDVEAACAELHRHLAELAHEEARASEAAFVRVNRAFAEYSRELLGGEGALEAERSEEGRLIGLRLAVQPAGKRTRNLNLLSAGERTMAGLGFLFALGHASPDAAAGLAGGLPLAVLDEVDAPLDEANIRRFTHFLKLFAERGTQFLLVTHQKATMEVAHAIWGVTTDQMGASKLLSIRQGANG